MIKREDIIADLHTHTLASKHAYSTLKENIEFAKEQGLKYMAITDHYYNDGTNIEKKNEVARGVYVWRINNFEDGITIIPSFEFNLNQDWTEPEKLKDLKWRPVGLHSWFLDFANITLNELYLYFVSAYEAHDVNAFVHIERELHKVDHGKHGVIDDEIKWFLDKIVLFAKRNNIVLEVNETSMIFNEGGSIERMKYWIQVAKDANLIISLGSDGHYYKEIGQFGNVIKLLNEVDYPKELIVNCNEELIKKYL